MLASDHKPWVIKFKNNPQHIRTLANELIASTVAGAVGLSVPKSAIIHVPKSVIDESPDLSMRIPLRGSVKFEPGLQFGTEFIGSLNSELPCDAFPDPELAKVTNLFEFHGILCLDKWMSNCDARQAIFTRTHELETYRATFIDHGFCFGVGEWTFPDNVYRGVYRSNHAYQGVTGWDSFEPWISRLETFDPTRMAEVLRRIPQEWYGGAREEVERLLESLLYRRSHIRGLIKLFRDSDREPFPGWV